MQFSAFS